MSRKFIHFGNALIDPELVAAVSVGAKTPFTITISVGFHQVTIPYQWTPSECHTKEEFLALALRIVESLPKPENFVAVGTAGWVNADRVHSITWGSTFVDVWLDLPGPCEPIRFIQSPLKESAQKSAANLLAVAVATALRTNTNQHK